MPTIFNEALAAPFLFAFAPVPLLLYADTLAGRRRGYRLTRGYARLLAGLAVGGLRLLAGPFSGR